MAINETLWLSGNEAIARAAWEAGVTVASGYPGTPSPESLENLVKYDAVYTEWAPNEKVAMEVALGASFGGARVLTTLKHVGLNVAADPLFTAAYTGIRGGMVIINADDPEMHSSQNEQDNRNYAYAAKIPMLEPADPSEAHDMLLEAFELSEQMDTPVILRTTTRVAHVKGVVAVGERTTGTVEIGFFKDPAKFVMLPGNARARRKDLALRFDALRAFAENYAGNKIAEGDKKIGIITSGISYLYTKEAFPDVSILKLGLCWPLPEQKIRAFADSVDEVVIVEELDPFLETHIKAMGIQCIGKEKIPAIGELNAAIVKQALGGETADVMAPVDMVMRPPNMCPGCPHRGIFYNLSKLDVFVSGDIGCYTLGFLPPLSAMDSCVCMGASIGIAHGLTKAIGGDSHKKTVAVIGDSTFMHSGITGLANMVYNKSHATVLLLDNRITGMTGQQPNPASGSTLMGEAANVIDFEQLCRAVGVEHVQTVNPHDINGTQKVLKEELERDATSVIICRAPCVLIPEMKKKKTTPYTLAVDDCTGCQACVRLGCPAINWQAITPDEAKSLGKKEKQKGYTTISPEMCNGCGQCASVCKFDAITEETK
ncbi:MAG: indolepyruvate ferredoxin oxidoreductase subunit alpha [Spirochaetales bacterium]|jgi:indolepyruvate ferredoxin oxidoreductase alpha subunit|nr:indolepyruvate ferredoxin oxidoreductase subunit alpha [Spirochaetales bacterium]